MTSLTLLQDTLHPWERLLIENVHFIQPENEVWTALSRERCFAASDGSAPQHKGSFAWILSNNKGERLARCSGPVLGHAISSYRAEGFGMLSFLRFLSRMQEIHGQNRQRLIAPHLVCDNQGIVQSVDKLSKFPSIFPNTTMEAEWDVLAQILKELTHLSRSSPDIEHIQGHQDSRTPYEQLSLLAQLNCDTDAHANAYLRENPTLDHKTTPIFPAAECLLQLHHGTISRDIKYECSEARNLPPLQKKIIQTSDWATHDVFDLIDWGAHSRALNKQGKHFPTLVKYIHHILPLGMRVHKYDRKYPPNCPSCREPSETLHHFWRCQAATRLTWRRNFLKQLDKRLIELGTGPEVRKLLVSKLRAVLDGQSPETVPADLQITELNTQQELIGWEQILRGRMSKVWNTHTRTQPGQPTTTKRQWTTEVICFVFEQWWQLWELRNQDRHGRDLATRLQADAIQLDRELTMFYEDYEGKVPQQRSWLFDTSMATHRDRPISATRQWLNTWKPIIDDLMNPNGPPEGDPHNPENYPYSTALETG